MTENKNTQEQLLQDNNSVKIANAEHQTKTDNDGVNSQNTENSETEIIEVVQEIIDILAEQHNIKDKTKISRHTSLIKDLGLDSLDLTESILTMEDKFHCHISDDDASKLHTIDAIARYIVKNRNKSI